MAALQSPFRYDFVGSFLRPQHLKEARAQFKAGEIDRAALTAVENEEITCLTVIQELYAVGCRSIQFDDCTWGMLGDPNYQNFLKETNTKVEDMAEKYLPLDRLCLSPQCGFASCKIGNKLTELEQWNKLKLVKEIAETVWGK